MKKAIMILWVSAVMGLAGVSGGFASEQAEPAVEVAPVTETQPEGDKPLVQMAILLDTSGSMSGLIDQARTELWSIVNEFIFAQRNGQQPHLYTQWLEAAIYGVFVCHFK